LFQQPFESIFLASIPFINLYIFNMKFYHNFNFFLFWIKYKKKREKMKALIIFSLFFLKLFAIEIDSFESSFIQTITNNSNKKIEYFGKLYFKKPIKILWRYEKPIKKDIFITENRVTIIEPELEQITISENFEVKNIINILKNATKLSNELYLAKYNNQKYLIYLSKNGILKKIEFRDDFNNMVEILFLNPKQNIDINDSIFKIYIDPTFDIIYN